MYRHCLAFALSLGLFASVGLGGENARKLGFEVPEGFEVSLYADDALATDIHALTIDAKGRVVVASKGYVKILHDTKGIGRADKATLFASFPRSGAHGMYFDGNDLICNGDQGVRRLYDTKGIGACDKISDAWFKTKNDGEHAANGILRGPDGWYYMITGNDAGMTKDLINTSTSPVKEINSGVVMRFSPDGSQREIVAHGFRNPYDFAFNHLGHLFTVDADGERIHQMPYYAPTRLFDIGTGMHHGWLLPGWQRGWSRPASWPDNVERLVEIGRGSPTGVVVYRHRAFPERYRNGVFSLCWSFGRLYFFPLTRKGSSYESKMEVFLRTTGNVGFAPTDMAVGPNGDLFIAIGGRGTRGSVFRVYYKGQPPAPPGNGDPLRAVLAADEPLSSWSRARWVPAAQKLGKDVFVQAALEKKLPLAERIRALEVLTELFGGVPAQFAAKLCDASTDPELTARTVWALGRHLNSDDARNLVVKTTSTKEPRVARAAWEVLQCQPLDYFRLKIAPDWHAALNSPDRRVRATAILASKDRAFLTRAAANVDIKSSSGERLVLNWLCPQAIQDATTFGGYARNCIDILGKEQNTALKLEAIRLLQISLGDVEIKKKDNPFIGYQAAGADIPGYQLAYKAEQKFAPALAELFPTGDADLDQELARLLGMLAVEVPGLPERLAKKWTPQSSPQQDIHYLMVLAQIPGKYAPETTKQVAAALNGIHIKLARQNNKPSDQVPAILEALCERLLSRDPALAAALVSDSQFGVPGHALYANKLPLAEKQAAARKLLAGIAKLDEDDARAAWTPELVPLVGALPDAEALPVLRERFTDPRLTDTIALWLAKKAQPEDRPRLVDALSSTQASVVTAAAGALVTNAKAKAEPMEIGKAVRALRRLESQKVDVKTRQAVVGLLTQWTGKKLDSAPQWLSWYSETYPKHAASLPGLASADFATWKKRLDKIDWDGGDVKRGEAIFQRKNCYRCHGEARRLGPDLSGIGQRFSRDDLFIAIIDPSKDIAPAYKATTIITKSGKLHNGILIYESPDLTLMQTTPDTTVRLERAEVQLVQPSNVSFMPAGLLDDLSDADLRDLYAYLKNLRKGP